MRLLICAGGTGGGVYPALAVLKALTSGVENLKLKVEGSVRPTISDLQPTTLEFSTLWVGGVGGMEEDLVARAGLPFEAIQAAGVHGVDLRAMPGNLLRLGRGYRQSKRILKRFRPDALFFTGGYVAVPMALAGHSTPSLLYVPDIEPGLALKTLARFSSRIAVNTEDSRKYFSQHKEIIVTGYPVRSDLKSWSIEEAHQAFSLSQDIPTLLVFGGSKGARSINRALLPVLPDLLSEMQVIHITGQLDWPEVEAARTALSEGLLSRYRAAPYLHSEMGAALTVADLALSRAGASTLGEFPLFGVPAILVPYPYAWRYQRVNAEYLVQSGAAVMVRDQDLPAQLLQVVRELMKDRRRRDQMRQAMRSLARPEAAWTIANLLVNLVAGQRQEGM